MVKIIAKILSALLSPLILPTYGMIIALWTTWLSAMPVENRIAATCVVFILTNLLPLAVISFLMRMKIVTSLAMNNNRERNIPFIVAILCYVGCAFYLSTVNAPMWLILFMVAASLTAITCAIINIWWKISIHCAAVAGVLALAVYIQSGAIYTCEMLPIISVAILCLGATASARLILNRHTMAQILAGSAVGFLWVWLII